MLNKQNQKQIFANLFHHINSMNLELFSEKLRLDQVTLSDIFNVYTSIFYMLTSYKYKNIAVKLVAENYVFIYMVTITSHKSKTNRNTNNDRLTYIYPKLC